MEKDVDFSLEMPHGESVYKYYSSKEEFTEIEELHFLAEEYYEKQDYEKRPLIVCMAWQAVAEENLDLLLEHHADIIMFDLENEEEFAFCHKAIQQGKSYRAKKTYNRNRNYYCDNMEIYSKLSKNQKYAFHYMMIGMSQKQFQIDFGFNALTTAASHWNMVLKKFGVTSHYELKAMFR